jgi:hypothetical protein
MLDGQEDKEPSPRRRTTVAKKKGPLTKSTPNPKARTEHTPGRLRRPTISSPQSARKAAAALSTKAKGKEKRTYGRRSDANADKENHNHDSSFALGGSNASSDAESDAGLDRGVRAKSRGLKEVVKSKEIQAARQKFQEVDEWELSFESVDMGGTSSDWR